jgi:hypothetical protein
VRGPIYKLRLASKLRLAERPPHPARKGAPTSPRKRGEGKSRHVDFMGTCCISRAEEAKAPFRIDPARSNKCTNPSWTEAPLIETYYAAALAAIFGAAMGAAAVAGRKTLGTPKAYIVTEVDVTGDMAEFPGHYRAIRRPLSGPRRPLRRHRRRAAQAAHRHQRV